MKFIFSFCLLLFMVSIGQAQVPQLMSYQAVLRDNGDNLITNQTISVRLSILQGDANGQAVYTEKHSISTNENGLLTLQIGGGEEQEGDFALIDWSSGLYFLKTETDLEGGENYTIQGTDQLLSVPYALFAGNASGGGGGDGDWVEDVVNNLVYTNRDIALQVSGNPLFYVNSNTPAGVARVFATTSDGYGIQGVSDTGFGVYGETGTNVGVKGKAQNVGIGVDGEAIGGAGVHGYSINGDGVFGESDNRDGVVGTTKGDQFSGVFGDGLNGGYGVYGTTAASELAGVFGDGQKQSYGVVGTTENPLKAGVLGDGLDVATGVHGATSATDLEGVFGNGFENSYGVRGLSVGRAGVFGMSMNKEGVSGLSENGIGVKGESTPEWGVEGLTKFEMSGEELDPLLIGSGTMFKAGVYGHSVKSHGVYAFSSTFSGLFGFSTESNGVFGAASAANSNLDRAGVYGAARNTNGLYGRSVNASGIRASSVTGKAGEFEGEVHIENGGKQAKLLIEEMEDDNTAPCLVWSGDKYVRKRECWVLEDGDGESYFVSTRGIKVKSGDNTVFQVNADGTSFHKGLETFEAGLIVPIPGNKQIRLLPDDGISVWDNGEGTHLFHANTNGNAFAAESFFTKSLSAETVSSNIKNFKIDHPLDPENKYLIHTSIESDDRLNLYSGNVTTDEKGFATVFMPDWFEALNQDFRYQLTVIGSFARAIIKEEMKDGKFLIQTDQPTVKVSWQVSGIRHDKWALDHPNIVEEYKQSERNSNGKK